MNAKLRVVKAIQTADKGKGIKFLLQGVEVDEKGKELGLLVAYGDKQAKVGEVVSVSGRSGKMNVDALFAEAA